jgi:hypothetical protein
VEKFVFKTGLTDGKQEGAEASVPQVFRQRTYFKTITCGKQLPPSLFQVGNSAL